MLKNNVKRNIVILCVIVFVGFIFWNSSKPAEDSDGYSLKIAGMILKTFVSGYDKMLPIQQEEMLTNVNNLVRSAAHITEFAVFGVLVTVLLHKLGQNRDSVITRHKIITALAVCFLCALSDEIFQIFIDGRTFQLTDIACDVFGAYAGILCTSGIFHKVSRKKC